jgi:hypothetical protein
MTHKRSALALVVVIVTTVGLVWRTASAAPANTPSARMSAERDADANCNVSHLPAETTHFRTIQAAINDPRCTGIFIFTDTYNESVTITRSLRLEGTSFQAGNLLTFIQPLGTGPAISIANGISVTLNKLQLVGGGSSTCTSAGGLVNNGLLTIEKVRVRDSYCPNGTGGILNTRVIAGVFLDVWDNVGGGESGAGGMLNTAGATFNMSGVAFLRNQHRNQATLAGTGGGISNAGVITINATSIVSNIASSGAGIFNSGAGSITLVNASIAENLAHRNGSSVPHEGAGVLINSGALRLWYTTVTDNRYRNDYSTDVLEDGPGASIYNKGGTVEVNSSIIHRKPVAQTSNGANCFGPITRTGAMIISDDSCGIAAGDPLFDPAKPFGFYSTRPLIYVPQYARPLLPNSTALNAGDMTLCNLPLLGGEDIFNSGRGSDSTCDLGSMEMPWGFATGPTPTPFATITPTPTPLPSNSCDNLLPLSTMAVASVSSDEPGALNFANFAIDGNPATYWHTGWINTVQPYPHEIVLDTKSSRVLSCLSVQSRADAPFARIKNYEIYVSADTASWGTAVRSGVLANSAQAQAIPFPPKSGRYLRLRALSAQDDSFSASAAELRVGLSVPLGSTPTPTPVGPPTSTPVVPPTATPQPAANACGPVLARDGWTLKSVSSDEPGSWNFGRLAFDGAGDSYWHTQWISSVLQYPHEIVIDLGAERTLACFSYLPRSDNSAARIKDFEFYISKDGSTWGPGVVYWSFPNGPGEARFRFPPTVGRYVRLRATNGHDNRGVAAAAELNVFAPPGVVSGQLPYVSGTDSPAVKAPQQYQTYLLIFTGKRTFLPVTSRQ